MRQALAENLYTVTIKWPGPLLQAYENDPAIWAELLVRLGKSHMFLIEAQAYEDDILRLWRTDPGNRARRVAALCGETGDVACYRLRYTFCFRSVGAADEASYRAVVAQVLPANKQGAVQCEKR